MDELYFIQSQRKKKMVVFNKCIYSKYREVENVSYWRCTNNNCKATIVLEGDTLKESSDDAHAHESHWRNLILKKFKQSIFERIDADQVTPLPRIYKDELSKVHLTAETTAVIPTYEQIRRTMERYRAKSRPSLPKNAEELVLTSDFQNTVDGRNFLLIDETIENKRILVFCTAENLAILCQSERIFMDGTFKIVPNIFCQLYTLHGQFMGQNMPLVYCLLPDKTKQTYIRLFGKLKLEAGKMSLAFNPSWALLDFEASCIAALREVFPHIHIKGCYFHFTQSIWRKVQSIGLVPSYNSDDGVRKWIRRLAALALIPVEALPDTFMWVMENSPNVAQATTLHDYMVDTWIDEEALFPPLIWNHFENAFERTNNSSEGWHSSMKRRAQNKLNIFGLIELLKADQKDQANNRMLLMAGQRIPYHKKKYIQINERIARLKCNLLRNDISIENYIDSISYLIHLE